MTSAPNYTDATISQLALWIRSGFGAIGNANQLRSMKALEELEARLRFFMQTEELQRIIHWIRNTRNQEPGHLIADALENGKHHPQPFALGLNVSAKWTATDFAIPDPFPPTRCCKYCWRDTPNASQFADLCLMSKTSMSRLESGEFVPDDDLLIRIAEHIGLDIGELLELRDGKADPDFRQEAPVEALKTLKTVVDQMVGGNALSPSSLKNATNAIAIINMPEPALKKDPTELETAMDDYNVLRGTRDRLKKELDEVSIQLDAIKSKIQEPL
jgi:transcriptional regulator with XRE-family HTH domain